MERNNFVILCLRLLGIYFFVVGLSALPGALAIFMRAAFSESHFLIGPLIYLLSGAILFALARRISRFIIEFDGENEDGLHISASVRTAQIAFIVLGLFIFAQALPRFVQFAVDVGLYYINVDEIPRHLRAQQHRWTILIGPAVKLIISVVLIVGPAKISNLIAKYDESFKR